MNTQHLSHHFSTKNTIIIFGAVLLAMLAIAYISFNVAGPENYHGIFNVGNQQQSGDITTGPGLPVELTIPSIAVKAPIIYVGLAKDGSVDVPKGPSEVAWFQQSPRPGEKGSAVITGHYGPWRTGEHSVFDNLFKLKEGDIVNVKDDKGVERSFKVRETRIYKADESVPKVFNNDSGKHLNLITCNGDWISSEKTYTQRLVVFTDAVD